MRLKTAICVLLLAQAVSASLPQSSYEDKRCKCVCPSIKSVTNNTQDEDRILIIDNVSPNKCNCVGVILPRIGDKIRGKEKEFCPRCECVYENRNTTIIKVVVIIVIWIISLLACYMAFLSCLEPLLSNKRVKANYQEHMNEEEEHAEANAGQSSTTTTSPDGHQMNALRGSSMLNRVGQQQQQGWDKWKRQVREQRRNIYDRHTMLN